MLNKSVCVRVIPCPKNLDLDLLDAFGRNEKFFRFLSDAVQRV